MDCRTLRSPEMSPIRALMDVWASLALSLNCLSPIKTLIETEVKAKTPVEMLKGSMATLLPSSCDRV